MSLHEYKVSQEVGVRDYPFYALIMAAFRKADTYNLQKLRRTFPLTWLELTKRYHAPGGLLEGEKPQEYPKVLDAGRYLYETWVEEDEDENEEEEPDGA